MNAMDTTKLILVASAFVIAAMIITQLDSDQSPNITAFEAPAYAGQVVSKGDLTLITAQTGRGDEEMLFVLNNTNARLFAYLLDTNRSELELMDVMTVSEWIERGLQADARQNQRRR